jgi:alkylation response protein AidB-like acyl-CoA dehydrogenase
MQKARDGWLRFGWPEQYGGRGRGEGVNGQKIWRSLASSAEYCWLAVRTDPDAAKHWGISILRPIPKGTGRARADGRVRDAWQAGEFVLRRSVEAGRPRLSST